MTKRILLLVALIAGSPGVAAAQTTSRWQAWTGCWRPVSTISGPMRCVVPSSNENVAIIATVDSGKIVSRDTIEATGIAQRIDAQGCTGSRTAHWSEDRRRVFLHSEVSCNGAKRVTNGIVGITPDMNWLDIQTLTAGTNEMVRATRYQQVPVVAKDLPSELSGLPGSLANLKMSIDVARANMGSTLEVSNIAEAVRRTDTLAVQSWIVERGSRFNLSARNLIALADAGVPGSVTDVMIGASYPDHFALQPGRATPPTERTVATNDPYPYSYPYSYPYGYYYYSPYSYYGSGYYGGYYGGTYYTAPVILVKGSDSGHGRVVNGRGYSSGSSSSGSSGVPARSSGSDATSASSSSASSSSGSSGSSSSSGSSGEVRTAHPKPPA